MVVIGVDRSDQAGDLAYNMVKDNWSRTVHRQ
ncbi:hypothetical protein DSUL_100222 [Desulfovibrionales bacterium]